MAWLINGKRFETEKEVRDFCFNYVDPKTRHQTAPQGFKQDYRLASVAYTAPVAVLLERLNHLGHDAYKVD